MPADETRADDASVPQPGEVIASRYRVEGLVARGGMSIVLRARDLRLGHLVALKVLRRTADRREEQAKRFLREARIVAQLRSDHVVRVLDVDATADPPYLAMELLEGRTLAELLAERGALDLTMALRIFVQTCRGVADAHAIGVIHRDLKPSNVMIVRGPDGARRVKVIDFGISKPMVVEGEEPALTTSGQILGSPRYMAPEQVRGAPGIDGRVDVWALGAILYELLAGEAPFHALNVADTLARIVRDEPVPLRDAVPAATERVADVVARCLSKDASRRPANVLALLGEIESETTPGPIVLEDAAWPEVPAGTEGMPTEQHTGDLRGMTTRTTGGTAAAITRRTSRRLAVAIGLGAGAVAIALAALTSRRAATEVPSVAISPDVAVAPAPTSIPAAASASSAIARPPDEASVPSATPEPPRPPAIDPGRRAAHPPPRTTSDAGRYDDLDLGRRN